MPRNPDQDRMTGEIEPWKLPELTEFDPRGYLKVPGERAKLARIHRQCPSVFDLGTRVKTIMDRKTKDDENNDQQHADASRAHAAA